MSTQALNLFIVDDNQLMVTGLRNYLNKRFDSDLNISIFYNGASLLEKVDKDTNIVILDYYLEGENGNDILEAIKRINSSTQVIMLSSNEEIATAIDSFRKGASDYVVKGEKAWKKIASLVYNIITYPVRIMVKEFKVRKYLAIFMLTFIITGIIVYIALTWMPI